jgi:hypothetical protein
MPGGAGVTELVTALTDLALSAFAIYALRVIASLPPDRGDGGARRFWQTLFASIAIGALVGALMHALTTPGSSLLVRHAVWAGVAIPIGLTGFALWNLAASTLGERARRWILGASSFALAVYWIVIVQRLDDYDATILYYLPPVLFLCVSFLRAWRMRGERFAAWGALGCVLSVVAAAVETLRISLHPLWFNYDALYHAIQLFGLWCCLESARLQLGRR